MNDETPTGGTHPDSTRLAAEERKAEQGLRQFGRALCTIHRHKLYRAAGYSDFATYVRERWDRDRTWAYRQIWRCEVEELLPDGHKVTETQARTLRSIDYDRAAIPKVWERAVERYGAKPTSKQIAAEITRWETPVEAGEASEGDQAATVEETKAHYGNRLGTSQAPTMDYTIMVPSEDAEEFNAGVNLLKRAWEISSMVGVVTEAVRRAAEEEHGKAAHNGHRRRVKGFSLHSRLSARR